LQGNYSGSYIDSANIVDADMSSFFMNQTSGPSWGPASQGGSTPKGMMVLTSGSSTWMPPNGVTKIKVTVIGGGGGGNGTMGGSHGGAGFAYINITPGASIAYSVGGGGANNNTGNATWFVSSSGNNSLSATGGGLNTFNQGSFTAGADYASSALSTMGAPVNYGLGLGSPTSGGGGSSGAIIIEW
jgi:hypothetical protein